MPIEALVSPLPSELTTPPVTKICLVMEPNSWKERVGNSRGVEKGDRHRATTLIRPPNPRWLGAGPLFQHSVISIGTGGHEIVNPGQRRTIRRHISRRARYQTHSAAAKTKTIICRDPAPPLSVKVAGNSVDSDAAMSIATARPPCFAPRDRAIAIRNAQGTIPEPLANAANAPQIAVYSKIAAMLN